MKVSEHRKKCRTRWEVRVPGSDHTPASLLRCRDLENLSTAWSDAETVESLVGCQANNMITFTKLGNLGRLGNQLFQIASTIGIAIRNDQSFVFPVWAYSEYYKNPIPQIERAHLLNLDLKLYDATTPFHYQSVSLEGRYDWDIIGYLQSEKYFKHCENTIRE